MFAQTSAHEAATVYGDDAGVRAGAAAHGMLLCAYACVMLRNLPLLVQAACRPCHRGACYCQDRGRWSGATEPSRLGYDGNLHPAAFAATRRIVARSVVLCACLPSIEYCTDVVKDVHE